MDGQPLESGFISFVSADAQNKGAPVIVPIQKGKYELQTLPGKYLVQITAPVVIGKRPEFKGPNAPLVEITQAALAAALQQHDRANV